MLTKTKHLDPKKAKKYFHDKMAFTTGPVEVNRWRQARKDINIVDVRRAEDYAEGHIPGSVNLPKDKWESLAGLQKNRTNILYCYSQTCHLAPEAALLFAGKGYPVMEMEGGFKAWQDTQLPVEKSPRPEMQQAVPAATGR